MALRSFRHTLARLEQIRENGAGATPEAAAQAVGSAASIVERIVAAAAAQAEEVAAAIAGETHRRVAQLEQELAAARDARTRVESAFDEQRNVYEVRIRAAEAQAFAARAEMDVERLEVARLKKMLEADSTTRTRLLDALQTIQQVVGPSAQGPPVASIVSQPVADVPAPPVRDDKTAGQPLKLVASKAPSISKVDRELETYAVELFEQIQLAYDADTKLAHDSAALVDRLTQNVRLAYTSFRRRAESVNVDHAAAFEDQLNMLLNTVGESAFGRHLAIASYDYAQPESAPRPAKAEAS